MKYLFLVYSDEEKLSAIEDAECAAYSDSARKNGMEVAGEALESIETATTVRVRNGKASVTDGPFAETKEQLAGFYMLDAENLDDAIEFASGIPPARVGCIEIRPIRQLNVPKPSEQDAATALQSESALSS